MTSMGINFSRPLCSSTLLCRNAQKAEYFGQRGEGKFGGWKNFDGVKDLAYLSGGQAVNLSEPARIIWSSFRGRIF